MPRGGAISQTERVRPVEETVSKTAAPFTVSKVRVLGAPPLYFISTPAWCNSSMADSLSADLGALPSAGAILYLTPDSSKENGRLTSGRPRSVTSSGDQLSTPSVAQKQSIRLISGRPRRDTARRDHLICVIGVTASTRVDAPASMQRALRDSR